MNRPVLDLTGRVAIVTGAGRGLGRSIAEAFAALGARLAVCDRDESLLRAAPLTASDTGDLIARVVDVRDAATTEAFVAETAERFGSVDVLVNNAGGTFWCPFEEVTPNGEAALIAENFTQVTRLVRLVVPHMPAGGAIVNITSLDGHQGAPGFALYGAMKAAVESLTRSLAMELGVKGIRVNAIAPDSVPTEGHGTVFTSMFQGDGARFVPTIMPPLGRRGRPEECANVVAFLASDLASFVNGTTVHVDGGLYAGATWHRAGSCTDPISGVVPLIAEEPPPESRP